MVTVHKVRELHELERLKDRSPLQQRFIATFTTVLPLLHGVSYCSDNLMQDKALYKTTLLEQDLYSLVFVACLTVNNISQKSFFFFFLIL